MVGGWKVITLCGSTGFKENRGLKLSVHCTGKKHFTTSWGQFDTETDE